MRFVDKQNNRMRAALDFIQHATQTILKFTFYTGARLQQPQVQRMQRYIPQRRRHVLDGDAQRQPFHHRGLADTGFSRQYRIVLAAPRQDVDHLTDFFVTSQHRIDTALARAVGKVHRILIQPRCLAQLAGFPLSRDRRGGVQRFHVRRLAGVGRQVIEMLRQMLGGYLAEFLGRFSRHTQQLGIRHQLHQQVAATHTRSVEIDGGAPPRLGKPFGQIRRQGRRAGIA